MAAITAPGACAASAVCTVTGTAVLEEWVPRMHTETAKTGTVVVVQIINTVLDTTSYSTIVEGVPSNYVPPATNAGGTKIGTMTYTRHGRVSTTTLAYPTPFLTWDDDYRIWGDYQLDTPSGARCVTGQNKTFDIPTNPQPVWGWNDPVWNLTAFYDPKDPLGWGQDIGRHNSSYVSSSNHILDVIDLLPDDNLELPHSVAKKCKSGSIASPAVAKAEANWKVVAHTSVRYEGGNAKAVSSPTGSSPKPSGGSIAGGGGGQSGASGTVAAPGSVSGNGPDSLGSTKGGKGPSSSGSIKAAWPLWAVISIGSAVVLSATL